MIALKERQVQSILIVDDSTSNLDLMRKILVSQDYQVELADNSKSALLQGIKAPPDLIVLNLMMSTTEGFEVTSFLRKEPKLAQIPMLLLNGNSCLNHGQLKDLEANTVIHKPFELDILLLSINSLLQTNNAHGVTT